MGFRDHAACVMGYIGCRYNPSESDGQERASFQDANAQSLS